MEMEISDTIRNAGEKEWEALTGPDFVDRSHGWLRTVEDSGMVEMRYVFLRENKILVAAACCFPFREERYSLNVPFLEVRSPLGMSTGFFSTTPQTTAMLMKGLEKIQEREKTWGIITFELKKAEYDAIMSQAKGFITFSRNDNTYIDLNFSDFDDYLSSLDGEARRSVRKTLNRAEKRWNIKSVFTNEFSAWKSTARSLQRHTVERHGYYRRYFTEQFYDALEKYLKENAELALFFKDDIPLVSGLSLNSPTVSLHMGAGIDPQYREYQAYFLLYYEGIRRAIEKKQKRIYFGATTYSFKEKIGCKREPLYGLVKMRDPFLNVALKSMITCYKVLGKRL